MIQLRAKDYASRFQGYQSLGSAEVPKMLDVVGALLIIVTAILADRVSERWKKWCWALFVLLVFAQAGLQIRARRADEATALAQEGEIHGQHIDIQNLMGELHKSETSRQVDNAILRTKLEDYSQLAQLGPALMKLAQTSADFERKQYETRATSDKDLYNMTMKSVKNIRDFSAKYTQLESQSMQNLVTHNMTQSSDADRRQRWQEETNKSIQLSYAKQSEFQISILPDAVYVRNELLKRKLPEPSLDPLQMSEVNMVLHGALAGIHPELTFALYLEQLAKPLAPK